MDIFDRVLLLFAANPAASAVAPAPCCTEVPEIAEREVKRGDFLGKGGFGEVYSGTWSRRGQPAALVAIKYVKSSAARNQQRREAAVAESRAEARITRGLRHTNIVQIHGLMPLRKKGLAIIMELVDGGPLSNEETMTGRVWSRAMAEGHNESVRRMTVGLVSGLQYLHDNGIVHRDLKPENILCSKAPVPVLKIADFGLAREIAHSQARMSTFCGTYMYMAPEIYEIYENRNSVFPSQPKYDKNADIYSFALIVFYILSKGVDPDHGWADWTDAKLQGKPPEFPDDFPADIREVVARGCSKSPKERPTLSSFRFALHPMMKHSWKSLNGSVKVKNCPEPLLTAARILSAIGNLYIMDLEQELEQAMHLLRALKREYFDHKATKPSVATKTEKQHKKTTQQATVKEKTPGERRRMLFAIANKVLGGLLSAHALLGREMLLEMAMTIAERYLVNNDDLWTNEDQDGDARQRSVARLSILGSFHLEFAYLSRITGDPKYREKALMMREILKTAPKFRGIYPRKWSVKDGRPRTSRKSPFWDGRVRFYDCLLKAWLMDRTDGEALRMFTEAIEAVTKEVIKKSASGMLYVPSHGFAKEEELVFLQTMESTHCFWGGLYALWSKQQTEQRTADDMLSFGEMLTSTCRTACDRTRTKLAPRCIKFENEDVSQDGEPATAPWNHELERKWSLRHQLEHETVESYFLLWRVTGDQRYRAWGWDVAEAIKKHCRYWRGYKGVKNVNQVPAKGYNYDIVALNATLKYLYLMFSDASFFPIDEWVFNSVGHPLPVFGTDTLT